ncbi:SH2 domain-containing adapter protein F-like isoform X2 [Lethenteron reissneri]|uniref:SH2 domain-containing adapter protein F-like isoform X2 n=1 Tax=Lethenteron reissneri TaxID=7753 RepID=UPI002AB6CD57|nr:SH2 domain-containing adapter protein F-like isoform X2 [Lethenteron reissneri]
MSRWIREHLGGLGFGGTRRPPPPEPPQPDYSAEPELSCGRLVMAAAAALSVQWSGAGRARPGARVQGPARPRLCRPLHHDRPERRPRGEWVRSARRGRDVRGRQALAAAATTTEPDVRITKTSAHPCGRQGGITRGARGPRRGTDPPNSAVPPHRERQRLQERAHPPIPHGRRRHHVSWSSDVEAKEEAGSVRPLPLHHLYDTPYEPPFARGLPQPESPSGNERVKAPPGDPARLAETAPPDPDCDPPASSSPTQALALLPSHPSTSRVPSALSSIPSEPPSQPPARDSRMPKDDDRPPEEYDQPWEWKRDCISQAFAADVSCTDELPWPPPVGQLDGEAGPSIVPGGPESSGDGRDSLCSSLGHGDTDAEPVGTAAEEPQANRVGTDADDHAMGQQLWFHGDIGRVEAEQILQQHRTSSFLVRPSESDPRELSLSLRSTAGFVHMCVSWDQGGHVVLGGNSPPFASVPEAVLFYRRRRLPVRGAEQLSLRHPVPPSSSLSCHVAHPACASSPSERRWPLALLEARAVIRVCNSVPIAAESRGACHTARSPPLGDAEHPERNREQMQHHQRHRHGPATSTRPNLRPASVLIECVEGSGVRER